MYRITFEFSDAGAFSPPFVSKSQKHNKHQMLTPNGIVKRYEAAKEGNEYRINVPPNTLLLEHVENMLRVFVGLRPRPTFRGATAIHTLAGKNDSIKHMATNAKIDIKKGLNDLGENIYETMMIRKSVYDSWKKYPARVNFNTKPLSYVVSWNFVKEQLGESLFGKFLEISKEIVGENAQEIPMINVFEILHSKQNEKLRLFCEEVSKEVSTIIYYEVLIKGKTDGQYFEHSGQFGGLKHWHCTMVNKAVEEINRKSGLIHIKVSENELEMFNNGFGFAKLLDGGMVEIKEIEEWADYDVFGQSPVSLNSLLQKETNV